MSLINGVVVGLVSDINQKGMVKVKFPWLPDEPETDWIRIATAMSGDERGTFFMPEPQDECLVAFEHGDTSYPYVVGFLWNGKDKPPEKDINVRRIKTKSGHTIEFNDNPMKEKIVIKSQGEHTIELDDNPGQEKIVIKSKNEQTIEINDTLPGIIKISTGTGSINVSTQTGSISISTQAGNVMIDCISATVTAKAAVNVLAPMATFSGVVQAPTIIAGSGQFGAVVSGAYNPGVPGNIFGL